MPEDFFAGVEQLDADIGGIKAKTPTFYREARCFTAVFPARLLEIRRRLPDRRFVPAQVLPGIGAVHLTAFEYFDTDIGPYEEFAVGFLLNSEHFLQVPGYNLLRQLMQNSFCTYIHRLPVTTEVAMRGGVELYNYPKFMASIEFTDSADRVTCELAEADDLICRISGRKIPSARSAVMKYFARLYQFGQPQSAEFKLNARGYGMSLGHSKVTCELGDSHPLARELRSLLISMSPIAYVYIPDMQAILYGPDHLSLASVALFMERVLGVSTSELAALVEKSREGDG